MTTSHDESIGDRLKRARSIVADLPASELSELAGLGTSHAGMIERGDVKTPSGLVLVKLASVLGVSVEWLVQGVGPEPKAKRVAAAIERARAAVSSATGTG
jgi:HTH-type transcriptional regulator, cell division transcriptional repressor